MDALDLAAALILPREDLLLATWDRRLHAAGKAEGLALIRESSILPAGSRRRA